MIRCTSATVSVPVRLLWHVRHVRPLPRNVSFSKSFLPWSSAWADVCARETALLPTVARAKRTTEATRWDVVRAMEVSCGCRADANDERAALAGVRSLRCSTSEKEDAERSRAG